MKLKKNLIRFILILGLLAIPFSTVYAQDPDGGDIVLFGQNYTVESGETLKGDIALFGGNVTIEENAKVKGDIILFGGNLDIDGNIDGDIALIGGNVTITGEIDGDIVLIGGQANLTSTAVVDGSIAMIGGNLNKEEGAEITGDVTNNAPPVFNPPNVPDVPNPPNPPNPPYDYDSDYGFRFNPFWEIASAFGQALVVAAIGMLLMLFLQPQLERAGNAMTSQPVIAGGFGLLTIIVVPIAIVIMAITILLIPVALIIAFIIPLAWLFGIVAFGQEIGDRFTKAINQTWAPVLSTGFGTFLLVLLTGLISLVPCVGWLVAGLINLVALGGVAMTWFGTRNATTRSITPTEPPATA
jgi:cytoskeletal protein CcmA (bactofilin family)